MLFKKILLINKLKTACLWKWRGFLRAAKKNPAANGFDPRTSIRGISHLNIVVNDIDIAAKFYQDVLGFERAANHDGPMDYADITAGSFARNTGFADGKIQLDLRFLKHPEVGIHIELMRYHYPKGDQHIQIKRLNDLGGVRHIAMAVEDASRAYEFICAKKTFYAQQGLPIIIVAQDHPPEQLTPWPYKFFYWIDPWGLQWEMEEGRPTDTVVKGIVG